MPSSLTGGLYVAGGFSCDTATLPAACVSDASIATNAAVQATKLQHQFQQRFSQTGGGTATAVTEQQVIHVTRGASCTLVDMKAGNVLACVGAATVTVDLLKNGTTVLTAVVTLNNATTAYTVLTAPAGFTSTTSVAGDVWEVKTTATAGGGTLGKGVFAYVTFREAAN